MGGKSSKKVVSGRYASHGCTSNSYGYPQHPQPPMSQPYASPSPYQSYADQAPATTKKKLDRNFSRIDDNYNNLEQTCCDCGKDPLLCPNKKKD